jgi:hypothetical protein
VNRKPRLGGTAPHHSFAVLSRPAGRAFLWLQPTGAKASEAVIQNWWRQWMMGGANLHYAGLESTSFDYACVVGNPEVEPTCNAKPATRQLTSELPITRPNRTDRRQQRLLSDSAILETSRRIFLPEQLQGELHLSGCRRSASDCSRRS